MAVPYVLFEWAWQHPTRTKAIASRAKHAKELSVEYDLFSVSLLLNCTNWSRIGLNIRFINEEIKNIFDKTNPTISQHIRMSLGSFDGIRKSYKLTDQKDDLCNYCKKTIEIKEKKMICQNINCFCVFHVICAHKVACENSNNEMVGFIVPIYMCCNHCEQKFYWADVLINSNINIKKL
ncbi:hypothetical protein HZS_2700 [Henneguya salminicola]|nr:hypothetical protein HZS_2700 [Henneguya salminicola]